jgi:hypothetical protein
MIASFNSAAIAKSKDFTGIGGLASDKQKEQSFWVIGVLECTDPLGPLLGRLGVDGIKREINLYR